MKKNSKHSNKKLSGGFLTQRQVRLLQKQVRHNSIAIDRYIEVIDLLANKERCPKDANTLVRLRNWFSVAIAENDTFRKVLWRHAQQMESRFSDGDSSEAAAFLVGRIKSRQRALIAQMAWK